jgi:hypothetical protein
MIYPEAEWLPVTGLENDPTIVPIGVILHVDGGNSSSLYAYFNGSSGGIESNLFVNKRGDWEQYRDTTREADAQSAGNSWLEGTVRKGYISLETQGLGIGKWTSLQFEEIAKFLAWCHTTHSIPLKLCTGPKSPGIGYHRQFNSWNPDGHICPGDERVLQVPALIARAQAIVDNPNPFRSTDMPVIVNVPGVAVYIIAGSYKKRIPSQASLDVWLQVTGQTRPGTNPSTDYKDMSGADIALIPDYPVAGPFASDIAEAVVAALPVGSGPSLQDIKDAFAEVLTGTHFTVS